MIGTPLNTEEEQQTLKQGTNSIIYILQKHQTDEIS